MIEIRDNRQKEWFWLDNEYLNGYAKHLGVYCTAVYISLCRHADNKTQSCFPSMRLIADENGMSTKTVERATKTLEEWGIISITKSKNKDGTQANNLYILTAKSSWKSKPTDCESLGKEAKPTDSDDASRQTVVLHNNTQYNNTQYTSEQGSQVSQIIKEMETLDPKNKKYYGNTTQRNACIFLLEEYGYEKVIQMIQTLPKIKSIPYMPSVTTPCELRDKWQKVIDSVARERSKQKKTEVLFT
jgi:biotin operon repressor